MIILWNRGENPTIVQSQLIYSDLIPNDDPNDNDDYGNIMMITGFITFLLKKYSDLIPGSFAH